MLLHNNKIKTGKSSHMTTFSESFNCTKQRTDCKKSTVDTLTSYVKGLINVLKLISFFFFTLNL